MQVRRSLALLFVMAIVASCTGPAPRVQQRYVIAADESCFVRGVERELRCVTLRVPLDWQTPSGEQIDIVAAIVPSTSPRPRPDPLVVLAGGPGQNATAYGPLIASAFREVVKTRDVILFDQRGTGRSGALNCVLQDEPWSSMSDAVVLAATRRCAKGAASKAQFYSMREVVEDLNALRVALGYETVNLWGGSYGTVTAQQYIRKYGAHVRTAVLDGALAPSRDLLGLASRDAQQAMEELFEECRRSECGDEPDSLESQLQTLLGRLDAAPRTVELRDPRTGELVEAEFSRDATTSILRGALYSPVSRSVVPKAIAEAAEGRFEVLAALAAYTSSWATDTMALGATLSVLCTDQMSHGVPAPEVEAGFMRNSYRRGFTVACSAWPHRVLSVADLAPLQSDVPVLILSGGLDPVTPPSTGEEVLEQFQHGTHVVMPDGGHNISGQGCAPRLMNQFLSDRNGTKLERECLRTLRRPQIVAATSGPTP